MFAGSLQLFLGMTGAIGFLMRFVGPLTIAPTLLLLALGVTSNLIPLLASQWGISIG